MRRKLMQLGRVQEVLQRFQSYMSVSKSNPAFSDCKIVLMRSHIVIPVKDAFTRMMRDGNGIRGDRSTALAYIHMQCRSQRPHLDLVKMEGYFEERERAQSEKTNLRCVCSRVFLQPLLFLCIRPSLQLEVLNALSVR